MFLLQFDVVFHENTMNLSSLTVNGLSCAEPGLANASRAGEKHSHLLVASNRAYSRVCFNSESL